MRDSGTPGVHRGDTRGPALAICPQVRSALKKLGLAPAAQRGTALLYLSHLSRTSEFGPPWVFCLSLMAIRAFLHGYRSLVALLGIH